MAKKSSPSVSSSKDYKIYSVVMSGGSGTRLWPESTTKRPKQYLSLGGKRSLLEGTLQRIEKLVKKENRYVVTVKEQAKLANECSEGYLERKALIFEPEGRNTGPCLMLSLAALVKEGASSEDVVIILPADHVVLNENGFRETITKAVVSAAVTDKIVTVGIRPNYPHTGFGYIKKGKTTGEAFVVEEFKEKPNRQTAQKYLESGNYFWNAGIFVGKVASFLGEFEAHAPEMYRHFQELVSLSRKKDDPKLKQVYGKLPAISFDYAVAEKSKKFLVMPGDFDWNDLGSWEALEAVIEKEKENTFVHNLNVEEDCFIKEAKGNIVLAPNQFVALLGVNDLVIVSNKDVLMVLPKKDSQRVKEIVESVKSIF